MIKIDIDKYKSFILKLTDRLRLDKLDKQKIFLVILVFLTIVYIDFTYIIKLQLRGIGRLNPKIISLKKDIRKLAEDLAASRDLKGRPGDIAQKEALKLKEIIAEGEVPVLLQAISDVAHKHKVKIKQINRVTDTSAAEEFIAGERLLPIVIKLDLSSDYHSAGSFINDLENARQFIEVEDFRMARQPSDYLMEDASLTLRTYVKK